MKQGGLLAVCLNAAAQAPGHAWTGRPQGQDVCSGGGWHHCPLSSHRACFCALRFPSAAPASNQSTIASPPQPAMDTCTHNDPHNHQPLEHRMVLLTGFLKMMGTASVALTGSTSSPASSRGLAALTGGGPHAAGAPGEAMRIKSPLIYSFPISSLENVRLDQSTRLFLFPSMPPPTHPPPSTRTSHRPHPPTSSSTPCSPPAPSKTGAWPRCAKA